MTNPELSADEVLERVRKMWTLDHRFGPVPGSWLKCPICQASKNDIQVRHYRYHERPEDATHLYRCDISFKCCVCSLSWIHGVAVPEDYYRKRALWPNKPVNVRQIKRAGWEV